MATKGTHGGARPNSGPKPRPPIIIPPLPASAPGEPDSLRLLRQIVADASIDLRVRLEAAKALAPFEAVKKTDIGKKEEQQTKAKKVAGGKYAAQDAPKLAVLRSIRQ